MSADARRNRRARRAHLQQRPPLDLFIDPRHGRDDAERTHPFRTFPALLDHIEAMAAMGVRKITVHVLSSMEHDDPRLDFVRLDQIVKRFTIDVLVDGRGQYVKQTGIAEAPPAAMENCAVRMRGGATR